MVEVADVRDRAISLTEASTGVSGDVCEFTRQQFEQGLARRAAPHDPVCMAPRPFSLQPRQISSTATARNPIMNTASSIALAPLSTAP